MIDGWLESLKLGPKKEGILQAELCQVKCCLVLGFVAVQTDPLWMEGKLQHARLQGYWGDDAEGITAPARHASITDHNALGS